MKVYVDIEAAVKYTVIKLSNPSGRERKLSLTGYVEWVLGDLRPKSAMHIVTFIDGETGALFARNPYNIEFGEQVSFFDVDEETRTFTGDRTEFIGRNGSIRNPDALTRVKLSGKTGARADPCGALQAAIELTHAGETDIRFFLRAASNAQDA